MSIEQQAKNILEKFPQFKEQPASISGKYHFGETLAEHTERCVSIMKHMCDSLNICGSDRDMLIAATYLHDLGKVRITRKGIVDITNWKYFEKTGYSRIDILMHLHPLISSGMLDRFEIDRKDEIKRLVSVHMGHWYKDTCPQPENLYERLIILADYLAYQKNLFVYRREMT